ASEPHPEAALAFARCLELDPDDHFGWYLGATVRLDHGDLPGYRRACLELLERFGQTDQPEIAERIAKICLLTPDALCDPALAQELANRAVTGTEKPPYRPYFLMVKGLGDYRAGHYADAVEHLKSFSARPDNWSYEASAFAVLALAQGRRGLPDEARTA